MVKKLIVIGIIEKIQGVKMASNPLPRLMTKSTSKGFFSRSLLLSGALDALATFVFGGFHAEVMRRRREWFAHLRDPYAVVWWVAAGVRPTITDAEERLASLREHGPTPYAFTVRRPFPPPGSSAAEPSADNWFCPA